MAVSCDRLSRMRARLSALVVIVSIGYVVAGASSAGPVRAALLPRQDNEVVLELSNVSNHPRLGVPDVLVPGADAELREAATTLGNVLWDDLDFEREYYMIARPRSASIGSAPADALPVDAWAELGADAVLVASATRRGDEVAVQVQIVGVKGAARGKRLFGSDYPNCRVQAIRACAHTIADHVHHETRRVNGVARSRLAFSSQRPGAPGRPAQTTAAPKEIYLADYDGANPQRLTVNRSLSIHPAWSPSGTLLAYASWVSGRPDIYIANLSQVGRGVARPVTGGEGSQNWTPAWSPDGTRLAFTSTRAGKTDIWVANADGSNLQNLTNTPNSDEGTPTWNPDGSLIAFTSDRTGEPQLYVMNATGTGLRVLVRSKIDRPTWSSQNFIAFTYGSTHPYNIAVYDFATGAVRILTSGAGSHESPAVAPNGRHIAFATTRWGSRQIATMDATGEHVRRVTTVGANEFPNWGPAPQ